MLEEGGEGGGDAEHAELGAFEHNCKIAEFRHDAAPERVELSAAVEEVELDGDEALTRRFYRTLERTVDSLAAGAAGRASADLDAGGIARSSA